jgi:hypothetical protein
MANYLVMVRGDNANTFVDGRPRKLAFFVSRLVSAPSIDAARAQALEEVRAMPDFANLVLGGPDEAPSLSIEEVEKVQPEALNQATSTGLVFFDPSK